MVDERTGISAKGTAERPERLKRERTHTHTSIDSLEPGRYQRCRQGERMDEEHPPSVCVRSLLACSSCAARAALRCTATKHELQASRHQ